MANLFSIEEPILYDSLASIAGGLALRRDGDTSIKTIAELGNEDYASFDINNIQTIRIENIILTLLPNTAQADLRENTFSFNENDALILNCAITPTAENMDVFYTRYFLSEQINNAFKATVLLPTGAAADYLIIPSYTTESGGVWRYTFTTTPHYFATIIPNFTQYDIPSSLGELTRNGESYNLRTTTGNLSSKEYRYTATTNIGTLEIKDDDYKQHYALYEGSANATQNTEIEVQAEPRLRRKADRELRLGDRFYGRVILNKETVELVNTDAGLNQLAQANLLGRRAFLYESTADTSTAIYAGAVNEVSASTRSVKIEIGAMQSLSDASFIESISEVYGIESDELIPIIFGKVYDCPLILTEESEADGDSYIAGTSDDEYQITNVRYYDGTAVATADFTTSAQGVVFAGEDRDRAKAGMTATVVSNRGNDSYNESVSPIRIIENLLNNFTNLKFTTRNFDTTEIERQNINNITYRTTAATVLQAFNEILEKCFLFFIYKNTGVYSIRSIQFDENTHDINENTIVDIPEFTKTRKQQASSVRLLYRKKENSDEHCLSHFNDSMELVGIRNTGLKRTETFETLYAAPADVESLSDFLVERLAGKRIILKIRVSELANDINLLDKITITARINRHDLLPEITYTVIGLSRSESILSLEGFL